MNIERAWQFLRERIGHLRHPRRGAGTGRAFRGRHFWRWMVLLILVLAAYPVLMTVALWSGLVEKLLKSEDLRVDIDNPAWTIWPGRLHLAGVRVYMNGDTQFVLSADRVRANIQVLPLVKRRFFVSSLYGHNVSYHMRTQVDDAEAESPRAQAFPPLKGLPGVHTKRQEKAEQTEERESDWTVQVENIDARVADLWFFEYRYRGDGRLRGGFLRGPDVMRVDTSVQDLGPGNLYFGEKQVIAKKFRGQVQAEIPELNPAEHADTGFFDFVEATIRLDAEVQTLQHLGAYLDGMLVRGGSGPFAVRVSMADGALASGSHIGFATEELGLQGDGFGVKSDWKLDFRVGNEPTAGKASQQTPSKNQTRGKIQASKAERKRTKAADGSRPRPLLTSRADVTYVSLARPGGSPFTVQVQHHEQTARLNSSKIGGETKLESARLSFPRILTTDLDDVGSLAGKGSDIETDGGTARASLTLDLDDKGVLRGPLEASLDRAALSIAKVKLSGNGRIESMVHLNPMAKSGVLHDLTVDLKDVSFALGDEQVEDWWMKLSSRRLSARGMPPRELGSDLFIVAKDAEPVIAGLAEKDKIPDLVAKLVSLDDLKIQAKLRKRGDILDVMLDTLESDVIDFSGRVFMDGDKSLIALLIGGETVSLGIYKRGDETDLKALAGTKWLNEKLRTFPEPEERVTGDKP